MEVAVEPHDERGDQGHDYQQHSDSQDSRHRIRPVHDAAPLVFTSLAAWGPPMKNLRAPGVQSQQFGITYKKFR